MNSKAKRLLSWLCVLALCMSLLPMTALAAPGDGTSYTDKEAAEQATGVTASKTATENDDGTYTITLSVQGYSDETTTTQDLPADIVLVVDTSTSMDDTVSHRLCGCEEFSHKKGFWGSYYECQECGHSYYNSKPDSCSNWVSVNRLDVAKDAAKNFVNGLLETSNDIQIGLYDFSGSNRTNLPLTKNQTTLIQAIDGLHMPGRGDGTDYGKGLSGAENILKSSSKDRQKFIVFLSDGEPQSGNNGIQTATALKQAGVTIFTVGIDTNSSGDNALKAISSQNVDKNPYFYKASTDGNSGTALNDILDQIKKIIPSLIYAGTDAQMKDIINTASFELVQNSASEGLTVSPEGTLTWDIGDITAEKKTASFQIKPTESNMQTGALFTNQDVTLTFESQKTDGNVTFQKGAIGDPTVNLYSVTYQDGVNNTAFSSQTTYNLRQGDTTPVFDGNPTREGYTFVGWNDGTTTYEANELPSAVSGNVTYAAQWKNNMTPTAHDITIQVVLDGNETHNGADVDTYIDVKPYQNTSDSDSEGWNPGTYEDGTVTYSITYYDCKDIGFAAQEGYVIEAIDADLVYGQSGCQGIYAIESDSDLVPYGDYMADNVQGGSTVTVYVRTLYTVAYYLDGTPLTDSPYNDTTQYVAGTTELTPTTGTAQNPNGDTYYHVDCSCADKDNCKHVGYTDATGGQPETKYVVTFPQKTQITLPNPPTKANYSVDGWYLDANCTGTQYQAGGAVSVSDVKPASGTVIKFYSKSTVNTAAYTVKYVFLDGNGDPIQGTENWTSDNSFPKSGSAAIGSTVDLTETNPSLPTTVTRDDGSNYALVDGDYSCTITAEGPNTITVTYALDNWDGKDNEETGGDGTPDYQQALIKYVVAEDQDGYGSVSPVTQVETFTETNGAYTGEVTASSTATASNDYAFDYWTKDSDDSWKDWDTELSDTFTAEGGKTYTYTANFAEDKNGDGTPDKYQVFVNFASKDDNQGTVSTKDGATDNTGIKQVYTLKDDAGNYVTNGNVTPSLAGVEVTAKEDFVFTNSWTKDDGGTQVDPTDTLENVNGGTTITFYAHFTGKNPNLTVEKSVKVNGEAYDGSVVPAGTELTYTIIVTNTGNTTFDSVTVEDSMWGEKVKTVQVTVKGQEYNLNVETGSWPAVQAEDHVGSKQALVPDDSWTCTYTYTVTKDDVEKGSITNVATATGGDNTTGEDEQIVWTNGVVVTPADITLYTGGKGYSGIVGDADTGDIVEDHESTGLPEPGYYIQLPDALNEALLEELNLSAGTILDLSQYVTFTYNDGKNQRTWELALYDEDGTSQAYGKNVYRLLPTAEGQDPVRLQITGETVEDVVLSDEFDIDLNDDLYREYNMAIYSGELELDQVKITFNKDNALGGLSGQSYTVNTASGELTIRGVTDGVETATVGTNTTNGFRAEVDNGTTYTINGSNIGVNDPSNIQLLVDNIVTEGDSSDAVTNALENKTTEALQEESITLENPTYDKKYMDLVDGNNGNVYVTPSNEVTITWPVPADAAEDTDFYVVHFDDLDREFSGTEAADKINETNPEVLDVTKADDGSITFTTSTFSPFVLVYEQAPAAAPSLTVDKELTAVNGQNPGSSVSVGDKLTYTITVTNGEVALSGVTITDTFNGKGTLNFTTPEGVTVSENQNGTYTITLGDLAANETVTITATYKVQKSDANGTLTNAVTVNGTTPGGGENPTDEDTEETPVDPYYPPAPPVDPPELNTEDHYAYIVGYEDGTVRPENNITRAEVATIFFRLLTDESRDEFWSQTNPYSDVSADDWYNNAVSTLTNAGILDGYEDGTFRPNGNITRAEFATITSRFFDATYEGEDLFPDIDGHWAQKYINESANAGIVNGYEDGTFRPQKLITRAEAVTMVNRTIERHPDADHLLDDMITWPDNPETAWYYEQIQEATNSHEYTMNTDDEQNPYEIWTKLLPNRDWSELEKEWSDAHSGQTGGEVV